MSTAETRQSDSTGQSADSQQRRRGAPDGNSNRTTHGCRAFLVLGRLPKGAADIAALLETFRDQLEDATAHKNGETSIYCGALIQTACRHEGRAQLLTRWLRRRGLTLSDRLSLLKEIGTASDSSDRCLKQLGLDLVRLTEDVNAVIDAELRKPIAPLTSPQPPTEDSPCSDSQTNTAKPTA